MSTLARRLSLVLAAAPLIFFAWALMNPGSARGAQPQPLTTTTTPPACDNGADDDRDGRLDHPDDPGCSDFTDIGEDELKVPTESSIRYSPGSGSLHGRISPGIESPAGIVRSCATREVVLYEKRPGDDRRVALAASDGSGRWRVAGQRGVNSSFYAVVRREHTSHRFVERVTCVPYRTPTLPVFTSAPQIHPYCNDLPATIAGTHGVDRLRGERREGWRDVIVAFGGDDRVSAGEGHDVICGGAGNDSLEGGMGVDRIEGNEGNDRLDAGAAGVEIPDLFDHYWRSADALVPGTGRDRIDGGAGEDYVDYSDAPGPIAADLTAGVAHGQGEDVLNGVESIMGSTTDDQLTGDGGTNRLRGGLGDDSLMGLGGRDMLFGDDLDQRSLEDGRDLLVGGADRDAMLGDGGDDTMYGDEGDDFFMGWDGNDIVHGGGGADSINGDSGDDQLWGDAGDDTIFAWDGDDDLDGGEDDDVLDGNLGTDSCVNGETLYGCENT